MVRWEDQGCPVCRRQWETGDPPPMIAVSIGRHAHLHRCVVCLTYWEQFERFATSISEQSARQWYPELFGRRTDHG